MKDANRFVEDDIMNNEDKIRNDLINSYFIKEYNKGYNEALKDMLNKLENCNLIIEEDPTGNECGYDCEQIKNIINNLKK